MILLASLKKRISGVADWLGVGRSSGERLAPSVPTPDLEEPAPPATPSLPIATPVEPPVTTTVDLPIAKSPIIDTEVDPATLAAMLKHVETCWQRLGETAPHWSVLTAPRFKPDRIAETADEFYGSGAADVHRLPRAAVRYGIALPAQGTCFELGCGVGRLTLWLAKSFRLVIGADISLSHLALAEEAIRAADCRNVELRHIDRLEALDELPTFECFYSAIVLQHNPPPVIRWLLMTILSKLSDGGLGFFQLLTVLPNYAFDAAAYVANPPTHGEMEMHALPHEVVLATIRDAGCELVEAREFDAVGIPGALSMEFFVRKLAMPAEGPSAAREPAKAD